jgi:hypothetical protein
VALGYGVAWEMAIVDFCAKMEFRLTSIESEERSLQMIFNYEVTALIRSGAWMEVDFTRGQLPSRYSVIAVM